MDASDETAIWVAEAARIERIREILSSEPDGAELVDVIRKLLASAGQGYLDSQERARLERRFGLMALTYRDTPGSTNKKLSAAWDTSGLPRSQQPWHPRRVVLDYVGLAGGNGLLVDEHRDQAATANGRVHWRGTARQLIEALRDPGVAPPHGLVATDTPCTPHERCELIAAFRGFQSASSYASRLRKARSEISKTKPDDGTVDAAILRLLSDIPHGR